MEMGTQCPLYYSSFPPAFLSRIEKVFPNLCQKQSFSAKYFGFEKVDFFFFSPKEDLSKNPQLGLSKQLRPQLFI